MAPNHPFTPGQGGRIALDRYDAEEHFNGTNFRHTADQTDVLHPSLVYGSATNVEQALENLNALPALIASSGGGFIRVPDGYDCWHAADGTHNLDPNIPTLDSFLNPLFALITAGSPLPAGYARLQHGGVVLIPSGTYMVLNTINVPPGITLLGEGYGTKLVNISQLQMPLTSATAPTPLTPFTISGASNATPIRISVVSAENLSSNQTVIITGVTGNTAANNSPSNPFWTITVVDDHHFDLNASVGSGSYIGGGTVYCTRPVLNILSDTNRITGGFANDAAVSGDANPFMFSRSTNVYNMVIADNFVEPPLLGDTNYRIPQNFTSSTFTTAPLISQQQGSNLVLESVIGIGRVNFSAGTVVSKATASFVNTSSPSLPSGAVLGTYLKARNCMVDGFSIPFIFAGLGGRFDQLVILGSKIRAYGYYTGDNTADVNNTCINSADANITLDGNFFYGNDNSITSAVCFSQLAGGTPPRQGRSKIVSGANSTLIQPASGAANTTFAFYQITAAIAASFGLYCSVAGSPITVNNSQSPFTLTNANFNPPYTDNLVLVDSSTGAVQLNLPANTFNNMSFTIKDVGGQAGANPITIMPSTGQQIDNDTVNLPLVYQTPYGAVTLSFFKNNWWSR